MSNRLFQGIVHQMTDVIERTFGVIDETGTVISCSELGKIGEVQSNAVAEVFATAENKVI
ncbi:MAG: PucR family transcriptional regulator, partial [Clostridia bacterium]|nr:PucR family transcriptional regulator [Clostridia bacterium]